MFRQFVGVQGNSIWEIASNRVQAIEENCRDKEFLERVKDTIKVLITGNKKEELKKFMEEIYYERILDSEVDRFLNIMEKFTDLNSFIQAFISDYINYSVLGFDNCRPCAL